MRPGLLCASLLAAAAVVVAASPAPVAAEEAPELEERLLEAELAELGAGDMKRAMAAYAAIEEDEKAPAPLRARALLGLARSRRKLGELEAARKALADLLQRFKDERDVARQAEKLLRELERGRAENPKFDWLEDLGKNPEVQARVFELAMEAVSSDRKALESTVRQLRALGTAALPVLDRVIDVSRDARQRRALAIVSLHAGRADRLGLVLDPARNLEPELYGIFPEFFEVIPTLGAEARRELAAAVDKVPEGSWADPYRQQVLILAGERQDLARRLAAADRDLLQVTVDHLAKEGPETAGVLAERLKDPDLKSANALKYMEALRRHAPSVLATEDWVAFIDRMEIAKDIGPSHSPELPGPNTQRALDMALAAEQPEALVHAARGPRGRQVVDWIQAKVSKAFAAKLYRAAGASDALRGLALKDDEAVPEYVDFLRQRAAEDPAHAMLPGGLPAKSLSPTSLTGLTALLAGEDTMTAAIALQWLKSMQGHLPDETFPAIERVAREARDEKLREHALDALLGRYLDDPDRGTLVLKAFVDECERRRRIGAVPADYLASPLQPPAAERPRAIRSSRAVPVPRRPELPAGFEFIDTLIWIVERNAEGFAVRFADVEGAMMRPVAAVFVSRGTTFQEELKAFLARAAADPELPPTLRLASASKAAEALFPAIDWPRFLGGDDPFAGELVSKVGSSLFQWARGLPEGEQDAIFQAGGASPQEVVRTVTMKFYPADRAGFAAAIEKGLRDSSSPVRAAAAGRLEHIQRSDAAPLLHEHLRHQDRGVRLLVIAALARFADRASIPKLVEVFDDPDLQIRDKALQAAQSIRQTIEEREKLRTAAGAGAVKD